MELKLMSDTELIERMIDYIERATYLREAIARYLDGSKRGRDYVQNIKEAYKQLKTDIRNDAKYIGLKHNDEGSELYMGFFCPSILGADAHGFLVPVNGKITQQMLSAVNEGRNRLTKYYTLERWIEVANKINNP